MQLIAKNSGIFGIGIYGYYCISFLQLQFHTIQNNHNQIVHIHLGIFHIKFAFFQPGNT
ncbi:hypothetical protein D3C73_1675060 [compost metagenome]